MKKILVAAVAALALSACTHQRVDFKPIGDHQEPTHSINQHFFVGGIFQDEVLKVHEHCEYSKLESVQTKLSATNVLTGLVTLGIYTPRTAEIYCAK